MELNWPDELFSSEELENTPKRYGRFIAEWTQPKEWTFTTFPKECDEMVVVKDIPFHSVCSHHLLPFFGTAHVGYLPKDSICGLSKLARTVDHFAHRPQVQERLTQQVRNYLAENLKTEHVAVVMEARHMCMEMRGIKKHGAQTITSAMTGAFRDSASTRSEFMGLIGRK